MADRLSRSLDSFDRTVDRLDKTIDRVWTEMRDFRAETATEFRAVRADISALSRHLTQIGWTIAGVLLAQLAAGVVAAVIALSS